MAKSEYDFEPTAEDFPPRIPPGEYEAICHKADTGTGWGYRRTLYLRFRIYGGEHDGVDLFLASPYPDRVRYRHKLHKQWMLAIGGPPPNGQRFSKTVFLNQSPGAGYGAPPRGRKDTSRFRAVFHRQDNPGTADGRTTA